MSNLKWTVGDVQITQITEAPADAVLADLMSDATPEKLQGIVGLLPHFVDESGNMRGWFQAFLVTVGGKTILIEGGIGNGRQLPDFPGMHDLQTDFLQKVEAEAGSLANIDYVISSHLHIDHVGWFVHQVDDQWVPTFPESRYIFVQAEYDFWGARQAHPDQMRAFRQCVVPVAAAGLVDFVDAPYQLNDAVRLVPTPGHTPHHVAIQVESAGQRAIFPGDVFPHPSVIVDPTLQFGSDADPDQAITTRRALLKDLADTDTLMFNCHFANPVAVKIITAEDGYSFVLP